MALALLTVAAGCEGRIEDPTGVADNVDTPSADAHVAHDAAPSSDAHPHDALWIVGDAASEASTSADASDAVAPSDSGAPADASDAFTVTDSGVYHCDLGPPLDAPIAGCMPVPLPSTGDPYEDCVRRINQLRCECQHLPPYQRWRDGETCANTDAQYDSMHTSMPHAGFLAGICAAGWAQDECPHWGSVESTITGCLQQMWDEGPGTFETGHGHYINMSSTSYTFAACGFFEGSGSVYAVQNFQ
jgi:hypothetical protein